MDARHLTLQELEAGLDTIRQSPKESGVLDLIVRRPSVGARQVMDQGELHTVDGLLGDTWKVRPSSRRSDGSAHPDMQINVMSSRAVDLIAQGKTRWPLAGDQLFIDLDVSEENLPPWTKLQIGGATIEVTDQPHTGCIKFVERFGVDAMKFVNSALGCQLRLRGLNARVVQPGVVTVGDRVTVLKA